MFVLYSYMQFIYQKCVADIIRLQSKHYKIFFFLQKCGNSLSCVEIIHISDFWNIFFNSHFNNKTNYALHLYYIKHQH